jgi:3-deoxy-D-manno-octulosonic-acid transferase
VGETIAALPILRSLRRELPEYEIVLSVTTSSGHKTAREQAVGLYDHLVYFPIDVVRFQFAAMTTVRPAVVAIMETELWMNFLWAAKAVGARTLIVNGRISERSFGRSLNARFFYKALYGFVDRCVMQTESDKERALALGARSAEVMGSTKFDQALTGLEADADEWRALLKLDGSKPVVVIGSTRGEEEEALVLDAIAEIGLDKISVVHAPRHLERVPMLAEEVRKRFGSVGLRSKDEASDYLLLDTYGELMKVYCVADVVVVGGGFADLGGQDIMQPLAHGKPVLHGPHMRNFAEFAKATVELGASRVCSNSHELASAIQSLLADPAKREEMGRKAREYVARHADAGERYARAIADEAKKPDTKR